MQSEQNPEQNDQPQEGSPPESPPENEGPDQVEPTVEEKLLVHEHYIGEILKNNQVTGSAVNRLEVICFSLIKFFLSRGDLDYAHLANLMEELGETSNLFDFWGVPEDQRPEQPQEKEATPSSE